MPEVVREGGVDGVWKQICCGWEGGGLAEVEKKWGGCVAGEGEMD